MIVKIKYLIINKYVQILKDNYLLVLITFLVTLILVGNLNAQAKKSSEDEKVFELGVLRSTFINVNINDATVAINTWANQLRNKLKVDAKFKLILFDNTDDMVKYNANKNLGMVILNSIDFLKLRSKMSLYPIYTSNDNKNIYNKLYIITKNPGVKNISELKGEKLGFCLKRNNPIPEYWIEVLLAKNKLPHLKKFFSQTEEFQSESQLILSVFFGQTDVGIITETSFKTMDELNPQIGKKIKILKVSPGFIFDISSLTKASRNYSYSKDIIEDAINISQYPAGRELLTLMKTVKIVPFRPEYLKSTETLYNEYKSIKK